MDAIITAGGIPKPGDPLYSETQGKPKALVEVAGKPMVQWVLDAITGAHDVGTIVIVGLDPDSGLYCDRPVQFLPNQGGMINNIRSGIEYIKTEKTDAHHILTVSSDIPAITSEMVDWMIRTTMETDHDLYYSVIRREVMEARFPNSNRSYIHLRGMDVCGGDMNVIRALTVTGNDELWEKIVEARKSALRQASLIGYDTAILLLLRLISLERGVKMASKRLNIAGRVIDCPYAEVGMDVDKPHQLEIIRDDLVQRIAI